MPSLGVNEIQVVELEEAYSSRTSSKEKKGELKPNWGERGKGREKRKKSNLEREASRKKKKGWAKEGRKDGDRRLKESEPEQRVACGERERTLTKEKRKYLEEKPSPSV